MIHTNYFADTPSKQFSHQLFNTFMNNFAENSQTNNFQLFSHQILTVDRSVIRRFNQNNKNSSTNCLYQFFVNESRMVKTRSQRISDANNSVATNVSNLSNGTQLLDGSTVCVGDLVWIRHIQCMDTPVIIQYISTGNSFDSLKVSTIFIHASKINLQTRPELRLYVYLMTK